MGISKAGAGAQKKGEILELVRWKYLVVEYKRKILHRSTRNRTWINSMYHRLNGTELYQEQFRDNLCLRYGLMPQDIPMTCNVCGKKLYMDHTLSCHWEDLIMTQYDAAAKEWGTPGTKELTPSAISYKPLINSRTVQDKSTREGA